MSRGEAIFSFFLFSLISKDFGEDSNLCVIYVREKRIERVGGIKFQGDTLYVHLPGNNVALCSCMCTRDTALLRPEVDYARGFDSKIPPPLSAYEKERETVPFSVIGTMGLYLFPSRFYFIRYFCNYFLLGKKPRI